MAKNNSDFPQSTPKNRRSSNQGQSPTGLERREVVPLRCVEKFASYDTVATLKHLLQLAEAGECVGIAFAALLRGNEYAHGYTGAAIQQPELAAGIIVTRVLPALTKV